MEQRVKQPTPWNNRPDGIELSPKDLRIDGGWRPFSVESTILGAGTLADVELVAGLADKIIEFTVLHFEIVEALTSISEQSIRGTFQDASDTPVVPPAGVHHQFLYDTVGGRFFAGDMKAQYPPHAVWGITSTSGDALEVDYAPISVAVINDTIVHIAGIYRYVDA